MRKGVKLVWQHHYGIKDPGSFSFSAYILKVTSYSKMAAGAPFIRSIFQANIKRKGKKRKWLSVSHFYRDFLEDPFNYVSLTIFYHMVTSSFKV